MALLNNLQWRYATKKYDPTKKVDQSDVDKIVEAARMAPTSSGLQPFRVLVISNQEMKEKIVPIARPTNSGGLFTSIGFCFMGQLYRATNKQDL